MTRLLKQLSIWFLVGLVLLPSFTRPLYAATGNAWVSNSIADFVQIIGNVDIEKESFDSASLINSMIALACSMLGCTSDPNNPFGYNRSAAAGLTNLASSMYANPPANTYAFVQDMSYSLGFGTRPAYAQGFGFSGLSILLPLWKQFRNIAYGIIAFVMVVIGFMVMLRKKIDPKTVVTVQNAIPRIVIALLLITFSYAIVGIMIDIMYVTMALLMNIVIAVNPTLFSSINVTVPIINLPISIPAQNNVIERFFGGGLGTLFANYFFAGWGAWNDILSFFPWGGTAGGLAIPGLIAGVVALAFTGSVTNAAQAALLTPALFFLLLGLVLLFGIIRVIFMLIDAYIHIIISLLISPLQLAMTAIPGTDAFGSWFRNLVSKLIVFPITATIMLLTWYLTSSTIEGNLWAPPLVKGTGGASASGLAGIIGLGMLLGIPSIVGGIQKMLKAEPVIPGGVATIAGPLGTAAGQLINLAYQFSFIKSAFRHGKEPPSPYTQAVGAGSRDIGSILRGGGGEGR